MTAPAPSGLTRVAGYERTLPVSGERVWENVRDWEHLPWLHSGSFSAIERVDEGDWGWRARIGLPEGGGILLELVIDPEQSRYVSRTLEGSGKGSEIWTRVDERDLNETHVSVEFWLPKVHEDRVECLGDHFVKLYTRLWDEDESMMVRRAEELARRPRRGPSATVSLGSVDALRSRLPVEVRFAGEPFRIVDVDGSLVAHSVVCPHRLGPLGQTPVEHGRVVCPWHGYAFDVVTGRECTGRRMRLAVPPQVLCDPESGQVYLSTSS
jgi:nitrite reductase/ring-hydroxylating ferredoxin subunit